MRPLFYKKDIFVAVYVTIKWLINNKSFEHANLIFTEPWALANQIMLNITQNFKFDFLENEFWADWCVHFKFHFPNLASFFHGIFSLYNGILELKNDTSILSKNGSFANKRCCGLTALFIKTKIYFYHCNFANKQINKNS